LVGEHSNGKEAHVNKNRSELLSLANEFESRSDYKNIGLN